MKNKTLWIFMALGFFALILPISISTYKDFQVFSKGEIVNVVIKSLPNSASNKGNFMDFIMNNHTYSKKTYGTYGAVHNVGDTIRLKYLAGYETKFLFPDEENPLYWGSVVIIMLLCGGIGSLYYAFKKRPIY